MDSSPPRLTSADALGLRLHALLLRPRTVRTPGEVVTWFGAMQAQDLASGEWSFGARCEGLTRYDVEQATWDRQIMRTWPMRGTLHFVPPRDARWMLAVTGARALAGQRGRRTQLGITDAITDRSIEVLETALRGGVRLTRSACVQRLDDAGLVTRSEHGYHLLVHASQLGVICMGPPDGTEQKFVLLDEWVPDPVVLDRDGSLRELARRYFRSHGPARLQDFAGWTGLTLTDGRRGVELAGDELVEVDVDGQPMLMPASLPDDAASAGRGRAADLLLLPGFDEYLLGYKDRWAMLEPEHMDRVVPGGNGMFRPTIVIAGRVAGTWRRTVRAGRVTLAAEPFAELTPSQRAAFRRTGERYAAFLGLELAGELPQVP